MVRPRIMVNAAVDFGVGIPSTFCTELPYCPVCFVFVVEKLHKSVRGIAVSALRIRRRRARGGDDYKLLVYKTDLMVWRRCLL